MTRFCNSRIIDPYFEHASRKTSFLQWCPENSRAGNSSSSNSPVVNSPAEYCSSWKSDFLFTREINKNIYNRLYLFVNKIDYLPNTFNINKMHSNKDLDLIQPVVCKCWYCHWDLFCNRYQQWSIHFTARFSNYLK